MTGAGARVCIFLRIGKGYYIWTFEPLMQRMPGLEFLDIFKTPFHGSQQRAAAIALGETTAERAETSSEELKQYAGSRVKLRAR